MAEIKLKNGKIALVDNEDYIRLNKYRWHQPHNGYACATINKRPVLMHRLILHGHYSEDKKYTDHINHNVLDNRKENLRVATNSQNGANQLKSKGKTSQYKGVDWHKATKRWRARICKNYKKKHLGIYKNEEDAARAYNEAAQRLFGEFALLNFV